MSEKEFLKEKDLLLNSIEKNTVDHWENYYSNVPIKCIFEDLVIDINEIKRLTNENQELKAKIKTYEDPDDLTLMFMYCEEKAKDKIKELNKQLDYLRRSIERKEETIIDLQDERVPYTNEYVAKLENQQKKFIEYLENGMDICDGFLDTVKSDLQETPYGVISANKTYITTRIKENETAHKVYKEILSKYQEIIGVSNEN